MRQRLGIAALLAAIQLDGLARLADGDQFQAARFWRRR